MTDTQSPIPIPPSVEAELRELTTWRGDKPEIWKAALDKAPRRRRVSPRNRKLWIAVSCAAAAVVLLAVSVSLSTSESFQLGKKTSVGVVALDPGTAVAAYTTRQRTPTTESEPDGHASSGFSAETEKKTVLNGDRTDAPNPRAAPADVAERSVIRKSTIELAVPDVRGAFAKAQHFLRADLSEFVEGSSLTGQDKEALAQLTLRVAASRLDEVMNQLRTLGNVDTENSTGDDVTAQTVDLDARLRNEKQVESKLLRLLDSRKNDQLKDILDLRDKLASIRQSIDRLQGRRDSLSRQVSLASILVILRPDDAPKPAPKQSSMLDTFGDEMSSAWTSGLSALTQTIAFFIRIVVGGLIWWLLLFAIIAIARRAIRRLIPDPARVPVAA